MSEEYVPQKILDENSLYSSGNMIVDSENKPNNGIKENVTNNNKNFQFNEINYSNSNTFPSNTKQKLKNKNAMKTKGDCQSKAKHAIKNSLSLKNSSKATKGKNKSEFYSINSLSICVKNSQSNERFNEGAMKMKIDPNEEKNKDLNEMNIEKEDLIYKDIPNNNSINNEINLEYVNIKNNIKEIILHMT